MNKTYSVHDHWTDINKKNDVDIESIDGVITGIKVNGEDFGGISWTQVFTGDVVTSGEAAPFSGTIPAELSGADTIKVIYNDNVYILNKQVQDEVYYYGATIGEGPSDIDFSVYPFVIVHIDDSNVSLYTQSPGPQDLTIFELQSGGGGESDFSTANLTLINNSRESLSISIPTCAESTDEPFGFPFITSFTNEVASNETATFKVALYKGTALFTKIGNITTSGNVTYNEEYDVYIVTGDCTITIS